MDPYYYYYYFDKYVCLLSLGYYFLYLIHIRIGILSISSVSNSVYGAMLLILNDVASGTL